MREACTSIRMEASSRLCAVAIHLKPPRDCMFEDWIGRDETVTDVMTAGPAQLMAATLSRSQLRFQVGQVVPPVWHWLYFAPLVQTDRLGADGHPPRGDFLPPVMNARRMRAGGKFEFLQELRIGDEVRRRSRIVSIAQKTGASGPLVFVVVRHEIARDGINCVVEEESIVYRQEVTRPPRATGKSDHLAKASLPPTPVLRVPTTTTLLFRFSALTFNSHRIHYDLEYAMEVEKYPGLVVQGPLIALLVLEYLHVARPVSFLKNFEYRSVGPVYCGDDIYIAEDPADTAERVRLRAITSSGIDAVIASATYLSS